MFNFKTNLYIKNKKASIKFYSLYPESKVIISDNSGIKIGKCINLKPYSKKKGTIPAGIVKISAQRLKKSKKFLKGDLCEGIIVRTRKTIQRDTGLSLKCEDNAIILIDNKKIPLGSRIYGPIYKELKYNESYSKAVLMARLKI